MATVALTPAAVEEISELPRKIQARMRDLLLRLESWPEVSGARPLRGELAGQYRLRFFVQQTRQAVKTTKTVKEKPVTKEVEVIAYHVVVVQIGHRDKFYEEEG